MISKKIITLILGCDILTLQHSCYVRVPYCKFAFIKRTKIIIIGIVNCELKQHTKIFKNAMFYFKNYIKNLL